MKKYLFILLCFIFSSVNAKDYPKNENCTLKGFVFDADVKQAMEYATISVLNSENDSLINGTITDHSGFFKIKGIGQGVYKINISFIGYEPRVIENVNIQINNGDFDLGQVFLKTRSEKLNEAVIVSDQQSMTYKIDRKIINVSQQHILATGTAIDILESYPSISIGINGSVSLRGSTSFAVLIDNRPSVLEPSDILKQIPANTIASIEIITNPTAKYDSEGTSGIINIITKKSKLQGVSGLVQANGGMYNNYGGDILLNFRKEKLNFYLGANLTNRGIEGAIKSESWSNYHDSTFYVMSDGDYNRTIGSTTVRGGIDFNMSENNILSFHASIGDWRSGGKTTLDYEECTMPSSLTNNYISLEEPSSEGPYYNMDLSYSHNFNKKGHQITSSIYFDRRDLIDESDHELYNLNHDIISGKKSIEDGLSDFYNFKLDYTLPFGSNQKFESGYKVEILNYDIQSKLFQFNTNIQDYDLLNDFLYHVEFDKNIHSFYSLFAGELTKFAYQIGLRAEYTNRKINNLKVNEKNTIKRMDYFPTLHLSYDFNENRQFMLSYTRRIYRPKDWQLEPFYTWYDAYNLYLGNPDLKPQYSDSYELSFINKWGANSFSADVYYRTTNNSIEKIQSVYNENIYQITFENVGHDYSLGVELGLALDLFKWWKCNLSGNLYDYRLKGEFLDQNFDRESIRWNARLNNTFKILKTTSIQMGVYYNSPTVTAQGDDQGYFMINTSVRQEFLKDFSATLSAQGLFGFLHYSYTSETNDFYIHRYIEPFTPIISLSISYKIKNYKYNRLREGRNIDMDEGEGHL